MYHLFRDQNALKRLATQLIVCITVGGMIVHRQTLS